MVDEYEHGPYVERHLTGEVKILQEKHVTADSSTINPIWTVQG